MRRRPWFKAGLRVLLPLLLLLATAEGRRRKRKRTWTGLRRKLIINGRTVCKNLNSTKLQELCSYRLMNAFCYHKFYNAEPLEIGEEDNFDRVERFYTCLMRSPE